VRGSPRTVHSRSKPFRAWPALRRHSFRRTSARSRPRASPRWRQSVRRPGGRRWRWRAGCAVSSGRGSAWRFTRDEHRGRRRRQMFGAPPTLQRHTRFCTFRRMRRCRSL
jgi:hypothetical protein